MYLKEIAQKRKQEILESSFYAPMLEPVKKAADGYLSRPIESLRYSEFDIFYQTGSRSEYEKSYFDRRGRLNSCAFMYFLTGEDRYKQGLEDVIWAICDEFSWALPAHMNNEMEIGKQKRYIDLFASETGFALSEIYDLLGDQLSPKVSQRISFEVRERIVTSYLENTYNWETVPTNWSAVCTAGVGAACMYLGTDREFEQMLPRWKKSMECYLSGLAEDGCCMEGVNYWTYGFGFFVYFADMLKERTNGEVNLFECDKVRAAASFEQKVLMGKTKCVSFSDGSQDFQFAPGLAFYLHKHFEGILIPDLCCMQKFGDDNCYRWASFIRDFFWTAPIANKAQNGSRTYFLPDAGWFMHSNAAYSFAAKCGHNQEPHNHNDVGSLLYIKNDRVILEDLGYGEYTYDYFNSPNQYEILNKSSGGHCLPIIGGQCQKYGKEYCGSILAQEGTGFEMDIAEAYGNENLSELKRSVLCLEDRVEITDTVVFRDRTEAITERFVTKISPVLNGGIVVLGDACLCFDASSLTCSVSEDTFSNHNSVTEKVYFIDFKPNQTEMKTIVRFTVQ